MLDEVFERPNSVYCRLLVKVLAGGNPVRIAFAKPLESQRRWGRSKRMTNVALSDREDRVDTAFLVAPVGIPLALPPEERDVCVLQNVCDRLIHQQLHQTRSPVIRVHAHTTDTRNFQADVPHRGHPRINPDDRHDPTLTSLASSKSSALNRSIVSAIALTGYWSPASTSYGPAGWSPITGHCLYRSTFPSSTSTPNPGPSRTAICPPSIVNFSVKMSSTSP